MFWCKHPVRGSARREKIVSRSHQTYHTGYLPCSKFLRYWLQLLVSPEFPHPRHEIDPNDFIHVDEIVPCV
ncbi:hypothetical protein MPTK1_1g03440 [Marchantia polymorpha subsp. ruderalis]|uniref:Uncharacterized protein n=2 Tax=Marchantia polymorpha TaxID=3197 RepID=A0AAF6AL39_MARPO|nr:hypothetical protein MARPO_0005s0263 [Marchantia polymorpha]BBM97159.1 hypothetical protein Mp_1g03440 [Marchantia polymorpha subsp. ruderalis]|eukprot:PTQ48646.1 hypothetical protein MARPO_0005s0263 [Marchantia polymorpha]